MSELDLIKTMNKKDRSIKFELKKSMTQLKDAPLYVTVTIFSLSSSKQFQTDAEDDTNHGE